MNYVDIDDLQEAFRSLVAGVTIGDAKAFRDVVTSHATDTGQLLEEMEAAAPPAAGLSTRSAWTGRTPRPGA